MSNFYEENHQQYFNSTVGIDPSAFLEPLSRLLEPQAAIPDAFLISMMNHFVLLMFDFTSVQ